MSAYRRVAIETYINVGEPSSKFIRARPLPGQGFPKYMNVECSAQMREGDPVGTVFVVQAKVKRREGGDAFLYSSWQWPFEAIDEDTALTRIAEGKL